MLKKEQAACRKNILDGIRACREGFLEVDHENAVINIGMLEENDTYVTRILNEIEDEFIDYNQTLSRIAIPEQTLNICRRNLSAAYRRSSQASLRS